MYRARLAPTPRICLHGADRDNFTFSFCQIYGARRGSQYSNLAKSRMIPRWMAVRCKIYLSPLCPDQLWAHPVTYSVGSQGVEQMRHAADHSPISNTEMKNQRSYNCVSPIHLHTGHRKNSTLHFTKLCRITIFIEQCCFVQCRF